ncbi:hypothetical protein A1351_00435 [Methylosinus sp. R-45379]|nr:hypothetical protein A1351_00435 [Methylosinus sp. R-45379]
MEEVSGERERPNRLALSLTRRLAFLPAGLFLSPRFRRLAYDPVVRKRLLEKSEPFHDGALDRRH